MMHGNPLMNALNVGKRWALGLTLATGLALGSAPLAAGGAAAQTAPPTTPVVQPATPPTVTPQAAKPQAAGTPAQPIVSPAGSSTPSTAPAAGAIPAPPPVSPAPVTQATGAQASGGPAPAAPAATAPNAGPGAANAVSNAPAASGHAPAANEPSNAQTIEVAARPAVVVRGQSNWDDGFKTLFGAIARARAAVQKAGLRENGRPLAAFVETDDNGFKFEAMIPVEQPPAGGVDLGPDVKIGANPDGKTLKFQHRGAYDDIDSTYEAITAYLDEKNLEARNVFVEEYLNEPKTSDDTALAVDIYVFIK